MSFDPDGKSDEQQLSTEDLLYQILLELKKIRIHLEHVTDEQVTEEEIDE